MATFTFSKLNTRLSGQLSQTLVTSILLSLIGILTGVLLARLLGPEGRGELAAIQLWGTFFGTLALIGIPESVLYYSAKSPELARQYWVSGTVFALISGLPVLAIGIIILPKLLASQNVEIVRMTYCYMIGLFVIFSVIRMPLNVLRAQKRFVEWNTLRILPYLGWLTAILLVWVFGNPTPVFFAVGYLGVNFFVALIITLTVRGRVEGTASLDWSLWPSMFKYGMPLMLSQIPRYLVEAGRLSQFLIAAFLSPGLLGLFVVATAWSNFTNMIPNVIAQIFFPRVSAAQETDQRIAETTRGIRLGFTASIGVCGLLALSAPLAIPILFGQAFQPSVTAAVVLVFAGGASGIRMVGSNALQGWGRSRDVLTSELVAIITSILLTFYLIEHGIVGVSIAVLVGEALAVMFVLLWLQKLTSTSMWCLTVPTLSDAYFLARFLRDLRSCPIGK